LAQPHKSKYPIEFIPAADLVSRCCFAINGIPPLDPATDFKFSDADRENPLTLSVCWRKYAVERHDVDQRGEILAKIKNERNQRKKRSGRITYIGYRTAAVQTIRAIRTERGFGFSVMHAPSKEFRAHAHIAMEHASHPNGPVLERNDKLDLKDALIARMPMDETSLDDEETREWNRAP
jgi:hypothetical protein